MQTYDKFPDYYDEIIRGNGYNIDSEILFLDETMQKFGGGKSILEFACGTGTIAKELIKKGYSVTGVDLSEQMIKKAKKNLPLPKAVPGKGEEFIIGDMTSINLHKEFDIVLCNYNSVCHLPDWEAWKSFFSNAYKHLKKNGIFIFDILTLFEFENIARDYKGFFNVGGDTICLEMFKEKSLPLDLRGDKENGFKESRESALGDAGKAEQIIYKWLIKMFVHIGKNDFQLIEEEIKEISFPISNIKKQLEVIGFSVEHLEDFHFGEVNDESERVYFIAQK